MFAHALFITVTETNAPSVRLSLESITVIFATYGCQWYVLCAVALVSLFDSCQYHPAKMGLTPQDGADSNLSRITTNTNSFLMHPF
jgi:hypothetical protein